MIGLKVVSDDGVVATIKCDGSHGGHDDYFSIVSVSGFIEEKRIYGIDPLQSFSLGWALIEQLTSEKRVSEKSPATPWRIEPL
jgi:hypothetical protein